MSWIHQPSLAVARTYWGALIGPQYTGTQAPDDWGATPNSGSDFETDVASGKGMSVVHFGSGHWQNQDNSYGSLLAPIPAP